ncbi:asparagine synthase-related protein [Kitasatospora aburaviensis]
MTASPSRSTARAATRSSAARRTCRCWCTRCTGTTRPPRCGPRPTCGRTASATRTCRGCSPRARCGRWSPRPSRAGTSPPTCDRGRCTRCSTSSSTATCGPRAHHILTKVERLTASQGVQGAPLFDRHVVDHAFATPPRLKLHGTVEKWVLKEAVRDLLPATVTDRPKSGMRVPVQQWLGGPLRDLSGELLLGRTARERGLVRPDTVRTWMRREGSLLPRQGGKLWLVLTLELWLRAYDL